MASPSIGIGLLGMGVVGGGVTKAVFERQQGIASRIGAALSIEGILVRDAGKPRSFDVPSELITTNFEDIVNNPNIGIVIEVIGGQDPAYEYIMKCISLGKHVVTANKEVMARYGPEILSAAEANGVQVLFEASVAGGTPIISPLLRDLVANEIVSIHGIINGTTNYILTRMANEGADFGEVLAEAQDLGYAESDPTNDVEGIDAGYKLAILSTLGFRAQVKDTDVYREGITKLTAQDFRYASELGYSIKLLAISRRENGAVQARVHPVLVPADVMLAKVDGVLNAVEIETDLAGRVLFHGAGAGAEPTTSAVLGDVMQIARHIAGDVVPPSPVNLSETVRIRPISELETRYYMRLNVVEQPGVFAQILSLLGDRGISIASAIQKEMFDDGQNAEIVLMTHRANEAAVQSALEDIERLQVVNAIGSLIRVEEWD